MQIPAAEAAGAVHKCDIRKGGDSMSIYEMATLAINTAALLCNLGSLVVGLKVVHK